MLKKITIAILLLRYSIEPITNYIPKTISKNLTISKVGNTVDFCFYVGTKFSLKTILIQAS